MGGRRRTLAALLIAGLGLCGGDAAAAPAYSWLQGDAGDTIAQRIAVPNGFVRSAAAPGSFGEWLRHLPLKAGDGVLLHDGRPVADHGTVAAVVDIDVGRGDLQQCADAVMRLRAEYLFSRRLTGLIGFELYSGERDRFEAYAEGQTPIPAGERLTLQERQPRDQFRARLARWPDNVHVFARS